ncbi:Glutathione transport system permease protein GsiC [Geodia barretti]|uniref:Glutathione transport system permease protein GsiC n=1 Tax=Geodia barretti TaxID=519541 RepID=A0AA35T3E2_GEOBA|nr:Glutathione transport system permease protein GsiC [Geodia barretti]
MPVYLLQRLVHAVIVITVVVFVVSLIVKVIPGDPVDVMSAGNPGITAEQKDKLRAQLGLTRPVLEQFASYFTGAVQGDLGQSIRFRVPVTQLIAERLPATLELTILSMIIAMLIALPLGVVTALRRGSMVDYSGTVVAILGVSIPSFVLGILLIIVFAVDLRWLPSSGRESFRYLLLPSIALALSITAWNARLTRSAMLEALGQDYVQFARAKGLPNRVVYIRHAFRNAMIPTITILGLQLGYLLGGTFVIENVFAWPGIGRLAVQAIFWRDYPIIQGIVVVIGGLFVLINIGIDVIYRMVDPRIRYGRA